MEGMIIDSFAGGGGASTGIEMALGRSPDVAINHSADARREALLAVIRGCPGLTDDEVARIFHCAPSSVKVLRSGVR